MSYGLVALSGTTSSSSSSRRSGGSAARRRGGPSRLLEGRNESRVRIAARLSRSESCTKCATPEVAPCTTSRSEEHTSELQSQSNLVCRLLLEKKKKKYLRRPVFPFAVTANLAFRREGFDVVGLLDPRSPRCSDSMDFCTRFLRGT